MNVLLIQPPDPVDLHFRSSYPDDEPDTLTPFWDILCLRQFLHDHTRHVCHLADCQFFHDLAAELITAARAVPQPRIFAVYTHALALGEAMAVLDVLKRAFPDDKTVVFGPYPSRFPELAADLPRADFALAGDPEPILRNLLDHLDQPSRLNNVPGLLFAGCREKKAYWLDHLKSLSLPDWKGIFWKAYAHHSVCRAQACMSRGHPRTPADQAFGGFNEPLRVWPMERVARTVNQGAHQGLSEIFFTDPPGFWTPERLAEWCLALKSTRSSRPWGLRMLPTWLPRASVSMMASTQCRRVEFIFPSTHPKTLRDYGCVIKPWQLRETLRTLERNRIRAVVRFWLKGPVEDEREHRWVVRLMASLGYPPSILEPFPLHFDSPLYRAHTEDPGIVRIEDWRQWALNPWFARKPVPLWRGEDDREAMLQTLERIDARLRGDPRRVWVQCARSLSGFSLIRSIEDKALEIFMAGSRRSAR